MLIPLLFIVISLVLAYLAYRIVKGDLIVLKYVVAAILAGFAMLFMIAALRYTTPVTRHFP